MIPDFFPRARRQSQNQLKVVVTKNDENGCSSYDSNDVELIEQSSQSSQLSAVRFHTDDGYVLETDGNDESKIKTQHKWNEISNLCGSIVDNNRFQKFVVLLILLNAIVMGVETFDFIRENPLAVSICKLLDIFFLGLFTIELGIQFLHKGIALFSDGWLTFDFFIVMGSWMLDGMQVIRTVRIVRVLRLITRVSELKNLVMALIDVIPKMFAVLGLLFLLFYIFAVLFTNLFYDSYEMGITSLDYFSRLDKTLFTLFQLMTLSSWDVISRELMVAYPWAWVPITTFIVISSFIVINLMIAVICDAVATIEHEQLNEKINPMFQHISRNEENNYEKIDNLTQSLQSLLESHLELKEELRKANMKNDYKHDNNNQIKNRI